MCPLKEPTFFAAADILSHPDLKPKVGRQLPAILADIDRGLRPDEQVLISRWEDYLRLFQHVHDQVAVGEASVSYIWLPSAAPAIHRTLPRAKLIFLLRDPAERLYTLYLLALRTAHRTTFRGTRLQFRIAKRGIRVLQGVLVVRLSRPTWHLCEDWG